MKDVGNFFGHLAYFTVISDMSWPFGIFCGHFGIFFPFFSFCTKKNLATLILVAGILWKNIFYWNYHYSDRGICTYILTY
jgi:hypothetical protein